MKIFEYLNIVCGYKDVARTRVRSALQ